MDGIPRDILIHCKKCSSPLIFDLDLNLMNPPTDDVHFEENSDIIIIPTTRSHEPHEILEVSPSSSFNRNFESIDNSTIMGTASDLSKKIRIANEIFKYISGKSISDHPMCQDCANIVIQKQEKLLSQTKSEIDSLEICKTPSSVFELCKARNSLVKNYLTSLQIKPMKQVEESNEQEYSDLLKEENDLLMELNKLQNENDCLDEEIEEEKKILDLTSVEYDKIVMNYNTKKQILWDIEDDIRSLNQRKKYLNFLADRLKRTNLLNVLFPIWFEDHFATINGFRMGKLTEINVEWPEINAGFGQCVLLLQNIIRKMEMSLENYKLVPCGNSSYIESLKDKKKHLLFKTGGYKLLADTKFDQAMIAYLDCVNQVITRIERHDPNFIFPYRIFDKHKIDEPKGQGCSIKLSGNSDENWTKALKYMLINMKWIKTWLVSASFKSYCDSIKQQSSIS